MAFSGLAMAGPPECQTELNGFLLRQSKAALLPLGKPFKTGNQNGWAFEAFTVNKGYLAFEFAPDHPDQIAAIQVTGDADMIPFVGIKLGDSEQQLITQVGKPDKVTPEPDAGLELFEYKTRNYTFEIDQKRHVYSLRIVKDACPREPQDFPAPDEFRKAVLQHNIDLLLKVLAGDVEFYKSGKTHSFTRGARQELEAGNTEFTRLLFGQGNSVLTLFRDERAEPDQQLRIYEKGAPASVSKFPKSKVVKEIVYKFEAGRWRVWEITFR